MKKLLIILCFLPMFSFGGTIYKVLSDTVFIGSIPYRSATGELLLFNATKDTTESVLYNTGNGKTEFKKVRLIRLNDSTYVFKIGTTVIGDSIKIRSSGSGGGGGGSGTVTDFIFTDGNGFDGTVTSSTTTPTLSLVADTLIKFASVKRVLDSITALRNIRKVDSIYKKSTNRDLTYFKINGTEYSFIDSIGSGGGSGGIDSIYYFRTFAQLKSAMSAHTLKGGASYQMAFQSVYDQPDFHANGTPKDTVVTKTGSVEHLVFVATSDSTFADAVSSIEYPNDKIKFDWSFTATEVMNAPAKGRISERVDDHNNRTDYDSRKVLFLRYESSTGSGIYSSWKDNGEASQESLTFDYSISFDNYIADSKITHGLLSTPFILPNIVANGLFAGMKIGSNSRNLTWMQGADGSEVSAFCSDLTFFDGFHYNYIGGHSTGVSCLGLFTDNYFGNLESVAFSGRVEQNSCWDVIKTTTIGDGFQYNIQYGVIEDCVIGSDMSECVLYGFNNTMTIGNGNTKCKWWDANNNTIGDDNINVDFSSTANLSASNDLSGLHNVIFSGGIDATGWVNFITNGTHPEMYLTYPKTVIVGSNGSVYTRYFNGSTDVITIIN